MTSPDFEIIRLASGTATLRSTVHRETFHPVIGPMAEAQAIHVGQQRLAARVRGSKQPFVLWDVGLGAAANAICAIEALRADASGAQVELHSFDLSLEVLRFALAHADELGYMRPWERAVREVLEHGCTAVELGAGRLEWRLHLGNFRELVLEGKLCAPDGIFYDPYSPATNPEMWTLAQFTRVAARLDSSRPCLLTCYSRSTAVRVTLLLAGFYVGVGLPTGAKEETTVASNALSLLNEPLPTEWLNRVRRSSRSAPLLGLASQEHAISSIDFERLSAHPQFE